MRPHELAGERQRAAAVFEFGIPDRPRVDHVRPDLKRHIDIGGAGGRGQPGGVRQQRLGRSDLDQDGRKARAGSMSLRATSP